MKFLKYIFLCAIIGITTNCTNLDEEVFTFITPNNYYSDAEDLDAAVVTVYNSLQSIYNKSRGWALTLANSSEVNSPQWLDSNIRGYALWFHPNNPDMTISVWQSCYSLINNANTVLNRGEDIDMDQELKEQMYGEVRFLRALSFYLLVRIYGGCPIPDGMTEGLDGLEIARKTVDETYEYIIADLEYAISTLPEKSAYSDDEKWKATKGSAQGILGEVYLTRGSMTGNSEYFTKSKEVNKELIESGEYALENDFKDLWCWWNTENENGLESIFEVQFGRYGSEYNSRHRDWGINYTEYTLGARMYRRVLPSIEHYLSYSDEDARKEGTFLTKVYITDDDNSTIVDSMEFVPEDKGLTPGSKKWTAAGPGNIKHYDRSPSSASLNKAGANEYVMRYSDVLLNYAEAENELNGATADAYEKINMVRNRANLPDLTSGLSKEAFSDSIYRERGWEFVGEVQMYFDGLRTDRIGDKVKSHIENAVEQGIYGYAVTDFYPKKDFLWKIPTYDFDSNSALVQNPDNVSKF